MCLQVKSKLKGHQKRITGLAFSTNLNILVSSGADSQVSLTPLNPLNHVQFFHPRISWIVLLECWILFLASCLDMPVEYWFVGEEEVGSDPNTKRKSAKRRHTSAIPCRSDPPSSCPRDAVGHIRCLKDGSNPTGELHLKKKKIQKSYWTLKQERHANMVGFLSCFNIFL